MSLKVLVACEFSGVVRDAFLARGHDAWSCDIVAGNSSRHIRGDVSDLLRGSWDLVICHPPCTYLCNSGVHLLKSKERWSDMVQAAFFFLECLRCPTAKVCVENPVPHKYAMQMIKQKYDQIVHPWQFGEPEPKPICLWLRGLPLLKPTNLIEPIRRKNPLDFLDKNKRGRYRSIFYRGVAEAMADQWGCL